MVVRKTVSYKVSGRLMSIGGGHAEIVTSDGTWQVPVATVEQERQLGACLYDDVEATVEIAVAERNPASVSCDADDDIDPVLAARRD